jgi:hypothetical protein
VRTGRRGPAGPTRGLPASVTRTAPALAAVALAELAAPIPLRGQDEMFGTGAGAQDFPTLEEGLRAFTDVPQIAQLALGIAVALALAALLAFHPKRRGRVRDEADLSYPNTILLFAVVGAIVAQIVKVSPAMALVVFGIGGLIRFRTRIGAPDDTGHAILATLVGIAAGMGMFLLAVLGTAVGWGLMFATEGGRSYRLRVRDLKRKVAFETRDAIRALLADAGWKILGEAHRPDRGKLDFYVRHPAETGPETMRDKLDEALPESGGRLRLEEI